MKKGAIRGLVFSELGRVRADVHLRELALDPTPQSAKEEAIALLQIVAEIEGSLMAQYLFACGSILPSKQIRVASGETVRTDDWRKQMIRIAQQEMGHLITVQNLLLSLNASPYLDRENHPIHFEELYPLPLSLEPISLKSGARYVCAEAPSDLNGYSPSQHTLYNTAKGLAKGIPRAGQIFERLFYLFQDAEEGQDPWKTVQNPFPNWKKWHVNPTEVGKNRDKQGDTDEWRGDEASASPNTATYVVQVTDKASARDAIHAIAVQGEGPIGEQGATHFDKFLDIFSFIERPDQRASQHPAYFQSLLT
jgi:Ferritin-like